MSKVKSEEYLNEQIEKEQARLTNLKKQLAQRQRMEAARRRKEDAHNKIVLGGVVLAALGRSYALGDEDRLKEYLDDQNRRGNWFSNAMKLESPTWMGADIYTKC